MKILIKKNLHIKGKPIWDGRKIICRNCGSEIELETDDSVELTQERMPGGRKEVTFTCPNCRFSTTSKL